MAPRILGLILCTVLGLAGCSPEDLFGSKDVVTVYSPHGPDMLKDYESRFEALHPEVDVRSLDMGSQEVFARISAERERPAADIWWGGPSTMFTNAAEEGLLERYRPSWADAVAPEHRSPRDFWYGTFQSPLAIVYNSNSLTADEVPQTWDELLDPKWKGKISIRKPLASGTMRTFIGAIFIRSKSEKEGIEWLRKLHSMTKTYVESPQLLYDHIKRNDDIISIWLMPDIILQRELHGYPFGFVIPPETPVLTEGIAIVRGAPHRAWAEKFYEFVTSEEALGQQASAYGKVPARTDLDPESFPNWLGDQRLDALDIDWKVFAEKVDHWCELWEREVYGRGKRDD